MSDETLDTVALDERQPTEEAVSTKAPVTESTVTDVTSSEASSHKEQPSSARLYAGKYVNDSELEKAYLESQREAARMAGELAALKRQSTPSPTQPEGPKWKQLEAERGKWYQYYQRTDIDDSQRLQADAQIRLYDREIAKQQALEEFQGISRRESTMGRVETEANQVITQYQHELEDMNSPLYQTAAGRYQDLLALGHPDNVVTKALAVSYAATLSGSNKTKIVNEDRKTLLTTLNKQAKQAVVAGGGTPSPIKSGGITAKDIENMTPAEFAKYEREVLMNG